ncbi:MAG: UDP-2,4-diacetamido-2,4,6-trideoxy-beta-L-altropyranose hydrolase [Candidatus Omnitrophica bacterium]|nr:UDP-2,4-diacetamido-2,4,6-trideoxy-beta-L-altropyranose hydrolase [Candidatus Omnitrophota bacterium]
MDRRGMKVGIITEGSASIGFGHITRCISLYEVFEDNGDEPFFIINGDEAVADLVSGKRLHVFDWINEADRFFGYVRDSDMVILDSYLAGRSFYKRVSDEAGCAVYIDDFKRMDYPKGVVLNGAISSEKLGYPKREEMSYILGAQYAFLRSEFRKAPKKDIPALPETALITFGGEDMRRMTPRVLEMFRSGFPELSVLVIVGKGFKEVGRIEQLTGNGVELIYHPDARAMRDAMGKADISISAGGQTLYELASMGVPTVGIGVADNQKVNLSGWEAAGFMTFAGWHDDPEIIENVRRCVMGLMPRQERRRCSEIGQRIIDGKSPDRAYSALNKILLERGDGPN